jgi:hypothetical protein
MTIMLNVVHCLGYNVRRNIHIVNQPLSQTLQRNSNGNIFLEKHRIRNFLAILMG